MAQKFTAAGVGCERTEPANHQRDHRSVVGERDDERGAEALLLALEQNGTSTSLRALDVRDRCQPKDWRYEAVSVISPFVWNGLVKIILAHESRGVQLQKKCRGSALMR